MDIYLVVGGISYEGEDAPCLLTESEELAKEVAQNYLATDQYYYDYITVYKRELGRFYDPAEVMHDIEKVIRYG